ncbi:DUF6424 family protein [Streptomyces sp. SP17BM10]|uniref:DUF6424 family protein n=1 Tax=Streptomyces sp. SP17BM10 TaxID=3002530 RepID=UPI002E771898|nr:DUF6424 family protein [Streptomyces sp. SP17BM10]MEE1782159.1 DUF6424 family protein [Streptomyces sp. SP17BM10]
MTTDVTGDPTQPHTESEDLGWEINIPGHPARKDSPEYQKSRARMNQIVEGLEDPFYGPEPVEDHHGGALWLKDDDGWFMVRNLAGIEWSAQFCADPAKVDLLRRNARRLYALCPDAVQELGIRELLDTEITDAAGVQRWTDSICNASVPLPHAVHSAALPAGGGVHHYPSPVTEIVFFKRDDFQLWVTDQGGHDVAVAPVAARGSQDGRVQVLYAPEQSTLRPRLDEAQAGGNVLLLDADHPVARAAFARQYAEDSPTARAGRTDSG